MDCTSCAMLIEGELEDKGIKASCNYAREVLEVELKDYGQESKVAEIVKKAGYKLS